MLVEKVARPKSKDPTKKAVTTPFLRWFKNNYFMWAAAQLGLLKIFVKYLT